LSKQRIPCLGFVPAFLMLLLAGAASAGSLTATWQDNATNETGFTIERAFNGFYTTIATVGANVTFYVDSGLPQGATYCYRVRAFNGAGYSAYSNQACGAVPPQYFSLTVTKSGTGDGSVGSTIAGINCGTSCSATFPSGAVVTLEADPAGGSSFSGWSNGGCSGTGGCTITLTSNLSIDAAFSAKVSGGQTTLSKKSNSKTSASTMTALESAGSYLVTGNAADIPSSIGIYRPSTGQWFLDLNGNGRWDGCAVDACSGPFGRDTELPVAGDWDAAGATKIGVFSPGDGRWKLDLNGNDQWDNGADLLLGPFGKPGDFPVTGDWNATGTTKIGVFRPSTGRWFLDFDGNGKLDGTAFGPFGKPGDLPVIADWNGSGTAKIGVFRPSTGRWFLDFDGNGKWDRAQNTALGPFGKPGDFPVTGDWNATGTAKIGVFRPSTGEWLLDLNGNGIWDGCKVDMCLGPFGQQGDIPVIGKW
jgi:hypothetical protein